MHDVFYFTDIHGHGELFDTIINYCNEQDPEAMIIFGGDACDRGKDGYRIMKELLANPRVVYLKGNHEEMFVEAAKELKHYISLAFKDTELAREKVASYIASTRGYDYKYEKTQLAVYNGGKTTLTDWVMDGMDMEFVEKIEKLPLTFSYEHADFSHSGYGYKTFKQVADAEYNDEKVDEHSKTVLLWGRTGLNEGWKTNRIFIFGHTPTPYLEDFVYTGFKTIGNITPISYTIEGDSENSGTKLDMDTGAVFTGRAFVLNVLTMKAQGFRDNDLNNKEINKHEIEKIELIQF